MNDLLKRFTSWHLRPRPKVNVTICTGCTRCKKACPTGALDIFPLIPWEELLPPKVGEPRSKPEIKHTRCTRCYTCQNTCPLNAIEPYKPWMVKLFRL